MIASYSFLFMFLNDLPCTKRQNLQFSHEWQIPLDLFKIVQLRFSILPLFLINVIDWKYFINHSLDCSEQEDCAGCRGKHELIQFITNVTCENIAPLKLLQSLK